MSFPLFDWLTNGVLCEHIAKLVHAKILYRSILTGDGTSFVFSSSANTPIPARTIREITDFRETDDRLQRTLSPTLYKAATSLMILMVIASFGIFSSLWSILFTVAFYWYLFIACSNHLEPFLDMREYIEIKWLELNQDIFIGLSIIRTAGYTLIFRSKVIYLEEKGNMVRLALIGWSHRLTLQLYLVYICLGVVPLLANSYLHFDESTYQPNIVIAYLLILYVPKILADGLPINIELTETRHRISRMLANSKDRFDRSRDSITTVKEQEVIKSGVLSIAQTQLSNSNVKLTTSITIDLDRSINDKDNILSFEDFSLIAPTASSIA